MRNPLITAYCVCVYVYVFFIDMETYVCVHVCGGHDAMISDRHGTGEDITKIRKVIKSTKQRTHHDWMKTIG